MGFFKFLARSTVRIGAVAAAVKISVDNDVWSLNTDESAKVYDKFTHNIVTGIPIYKEKLPPKDEVKTDVGSVWNKNVNCVFNCLYQAPEKLSEKVNSITRTELSMK